MENNYSNIIAPSDGVRRFLCKTSVLMAGLVAAVYCFCSFRMNMIEAGSLGRTLRTDMLFGAYVMLPLGFITSCIFARIKSLGLAYSMISLLIAMPASFLLLLNSLASLLRETRLLGITGSLLELITFGIFFALFVNLVLSCMDFKIQPVIGVIGAYAAVLALIVTSVRTVLSFSALDFAWKPEFEWGGNLRELTDTDKLRFHASWIFRSVLRADGKALHAMFVWRFYERVTACLLYAALLMVFMKYRKEMRAFNKLLAHASEYVDIPTARIYRSIFGSGARNDGEPAAQETIRPRKSGTSLKGRLMNLANMTRAQERGMDISEMADEYDAQRAADEEDIGTPDEEMTDEERLLREHRRNSARREAFSDDREPRRQRPRRDAFPDDREPRGQRPRRDTFPDDREPRGQRPRRDTFPDDREPRGQRPRRDAFPDDGDPREQRPRRDAFPDDGEPRGQRTRRDAFPDDREPRGQRPRRDAFPDDREPRGQRTRRDAFPDDREPRGQRPRRENGDRFPRQRQEPEPELTDQERYLLEERRKRMNRNERSATRR